MFSIDQRYVVVFNGEIYNYIELREELKTVGHQFRTNTDTEVLLAAYQEWGHACQNRFNGMWAFVIYDRKTKKVFASRDRHGIKPFYYYVTGSFFAFASEIPPLLSLMPQKPTPENLAIFDYLVFNRTDQTDKTFFSEIKKLQHGHSLSFDLQSTTLYPETALIKWYNLKENVSKAERFKNPEEYRELFSSSIGLRLRSDVPVGVCLSGGLDSSSIVSVLLKDFQKKDLNTFSAVYNPGQACDESAYIKLFSTDLKNMFYTKPSAQSLLQDLEKFISAQAEPISSTSPYAQYKVMELAKNHVVVTLDGQGADEELAGYEYFFGFFFKDLLKNGKIKRLISEMYHYARIHKSIYGFKTLMYFLLPEIWRTKLSILGNGYIMKDFYDAHLDKTEISEGLYGSGSLQDALLNHFEYKLEHLLKWEDRNSMWFSLEARIPFLDYRLVEKTLALNSDLIINKGMTKYILRESMKGTLPEPILKRTDKIGFGTPQDEWFRTSDFQQYILDLINSTSFKSRTFWDENKIKKIYENHLSFKGNHAKEIWKWIHLENWFRMFID
jgi:asparagine synthase (glutamine-hydrolysing)